MAVSDYETVLTFEQYVQEELRGVVERDPTAMSRMRDLFFGREDGKKQMEFLQLGFMPVRGDGRCLIRALVVVVDSHHPGLIAERLGELGRSRPEETEELIILLADLIPEMWDAFGMKGCAAYHMDESAIDGLAVDVLMKILGVSELKIFQFRDGAGYEAGWRTKKVEIEGDSCVCRIATLNGCHYTAIL
jgi:hypothetical protein